MKHLSDQLYQIAWNMNTIISPLIVIHNVYLFVETCRKTVFKKYITLPSCFMFHFQGDIAVLLRSGLTVPMAMLFNFISACSAYIGLFVGLSVGDLNDVAPYVFALTGGFFMYIALADMVSGSN